VSQSTQQKTYPLAKKQADDSARSYAEVPFRLLIAVIGSRWCCGNAERSSRINAGAKIDCPLLGSVLLCTARICNSIGSDLCTAQRLHLLALVYAQAASSRSVPTGPPTDRWQ